MCVFKWGCPRATLDRRASPRPKPTWPGPLALRYALLAAGPELRETFDAALSIPFEPRHNIAPTQWVPVVRRNGGCREVVSMSWGLLLDWPQGTQPSASARTSDMAVPPLPLDKIGVESYKKIPQKRQKNKMASNNRALI